MSSNSHDNHVTWYTQQYSIYEKLTFKVKEIIESLLRDNRIDFLSVTGRVKTIDSFSEKIKRKNYKNPSSDITDLSAIRIITFIESDIEKINQIIYKSFNVHQDKSLDKSQELGVDKFGYRSIHFICDIGKDRSILPEFRSYSNLVFEIQVRTVLQHAWAEIEHDRGYKFSDVLPVSIRRRLNAISSLLEIADREFNSISDEIDKYAINVAQKTNKGDFDIEITTTSVIEYIYKRFEGHSYIEEFEDGSYSMKYLNYAIDELLSFGMKTIKDLELLFDDEFLEKSLKFEPESPLVGFLRSAMLYRDIDKYFDECWKSRWDGLEYTSYDMLATKYGNHKLRNILIKYNLDYLDANGTPHNFNDQ